MSNADGGVAMQFDLKKESQFIKTQRRARGLSQMEMARQLGISQSHLSKIENGLSQIGIREWFNFCEICGISANLYQEFIKPDHDQG